MKILSNEEYEKIISRLYKLENKVDELERGSRIYADSSWGWFTRPDSITIKNAVLQIMEKLDLEVEHRDAYTKIVKKDKKE